MTTANNIIQIAEKYLGYSEASGKHKKIIDAYNAHTPLAQGYKVKYTDDWCDTFVSKVVIEAGAVDLIGAECGVQRHIDIFKAKGIWNEDGRITPKAGDIITFNWNDSTQANDGWADHIGIVTGVSNGYVQTIEGNYGNTVKRRSIKVGHGNIRGYARPKYGTTGTVTPSKSTNDNITTSTYKVQTGDTLSEIANRAGVSVDEIADWNNIENVNLISVGQTIKLEATAVKPTPVPAALGEIAIFQQWLNTNYNAKLSVDNSHGPLTKKAAIKALQKEINKQYGANLVIDGSYGPASKAANLPVKRGANGNITRIIQGILIGKGYDPKGFDGSFGPGLEAAVKQFQKDNRLYVDGIVGPNTWSALLR